MAKTLSYGQLQARNLLNKQESPPKNILEARKDIAAFGKHLFDLTAAEHHLEWLLEIQTNQNSDCLNQIAGDDLRISAPRGSGKTTWFCIAIAWIIGHNQNIRIILTSFSDEVALAISVYIKGIIEGQKYREIFPWIQPSHRWADGAWFIKRSRQLKDPTLLAVGMNGGIASRRADLLVIEDPIKSGKQIANERIRREMVTWLHQVLSPCAVPGSRKFVSSTRYRVDDIHGTEFTEEKGWKVISQKAIIEVDGEEQSYWPDYISLEDLQNKRAENEISFASQYQNDPMDEGTMIVHPSLIVYQDCEISFYDAIAIGIDLASSTAEKADYTALVVAARKGQNFYTLTGTKGKWSLHETILKIFALHEYWDIYCGRMTFACEAVAYQTAFANELKRRSNEENISARIIPVRPKGSKEDRLFGLAGLLEDKKHFFNKGTTEAIASEIVGLGKSAHDDMADAWMYAMEQLLGKKKLEASEY